MVQTEIVPPPSALLIPCAKPKAKEIKTNEDLAMFASRLILAYESCAAQITALRVYYGLDIEVTED